MAKIAVLVSGGVDSSVALKLLKDQGHTLTAFYLKIWLEDELAFLGDCPWEQDLAFVRSVCEQLEVPLEVVSLQKEYWDHVVSYTIAEVKAGRTPNPDILCNSRIKFGFFLQYLATHSDSFDKVATGHYAQVVERDGKHHLLQAPDPIKDQTYFLSYLTPEQLAHCVFPIGHLCKAEVRALAQQFNLPNKDRKDSQGICFLGKLHFPDFIKHYLGEQQGDLIDYETSQVMGAHNGFWYYTIGQRQGIGLAGGPWYVVAKDIQHNRVYISRNYYAADKERNQFEITQCNWLQGSPPLATILSVKLRHGKYMHTGILQQIGPDHYSVKLNENDQGIATGQFAVFYNGKECIGAGIIT
jgi:tRNA (5-methylaminomethyl-2-thiouridylate)-methyltransferase